MGKMKVMSVPEIAAFTRLSKQTIYNEISRGKLRTLENKNIAEVREVFKWWKKYQDTRGRPKKGKGKKKDES